MDETEYGAWRDLASAPRDGTRVLVKIRASEQGEAEVDLVRWMRPERGGEPGWVSAESDPGAAIFYAEAELAGWMPLPSPSPQGGPRRPAGRPSRRSSGSFEVDGSGT